MDTVLHSVGVFLTLPATVIVLAVLFGLGNATSMLLAICGIPWAWLIVICSQTLNITYLCVTHQWLVLIGGQPVCLVLGIYGLQRWLRKGVYRAPRGPQPLAVLESELDPVPVDAPLLVLAHTRDASPARLQEALVGLYGPTLEMTVGKLRAVDALVRGATNGTGRHRADA